MMRLAGALVAYGAALSLASPTRRQAGCASTEEWTGWQHIKHAFIFGDSYTQTGFNYTLTPPSPSNPLGNPAYPGWTSSNGPNWVDFLTVKYNASLLLTYNLAYGGATVDSDLVPPYTPSVLSLKYQVQNEFIPAYTGNSPAAPSAPKWTGADSIFAIWIGINDVGNSYWFEDARLNALYEDIFEVYAGLLDELYGFGARNFVFINVPPVDRSPLTVSQGEWSIEREKTVIAKWNGLVEDLAASFKEEHVDEINAWVYDSNLSFNEVIDDPSSHQQTALLKNTTDFCVDYQGGTPAWDTFYQNCGVPVNQYFWLNNLHPTYPINDVVAAGVAAELATGPNVCAKERVVGQSPL
jgi:phospholipase/lecithinase/hemolysin